MSTTLTAGGVTHMLPIDMQWSDEFEWSAVEQETTYTTTGAMVRQATEKQAGQPITLAGNDDTAWMPRSLVQSLYLLTQSAGLVMQLLLRGITRDVVFNHAAGPLDAAPVVDYSDPIAGDYYVVTLRFLTV